MDTMSNNSNSDQIVLHTIENSNVDIVSDEFSSSESEIEENTYEEILPYDNEDIAEAKRLGMSVEDLFKMYQEMNSYMNNYISNEPEYTPEWPFDYGLGYCDEGMEESYYG